MTQTSEPDPTWNERVRKRWNERVDWWDEMSEANASAPDRFPDLERTVRALNLAPGDRLLDAGCGTGQFAIAFARMGYVVSGVDIAPAMIERAREHALAAGVSVDWRIGEYTHLIAGDPPYDAIHARMSLQFVANASQALRALKRVLKPGGRLYVSVPGATSPIYSTAWRRFLPSEPITIQYLTPWDLEKLLPELGLTVVDQWGDQSGERLQQALSDDALTPGERLRIQQTLSFTWALIAEK